MEQTRFVEQVKEADYIFTGEGKIDGQTLHGKLIQGITNLAQQYDTPVIALCGALLATPEQIQQLGLQAAFSISPHPSTLIEALDQTEKNLVQTAFNVAQLL